MGFTNKIDARTLSLVLIALIGGVVGGYISNATMRDIRIEGLSNALTTQLSSKDTEIATLRDELSMLEMQVIDIETTIVGFNTPDYDSGWLTFNHEENIMGTFIWVDVQHNLDTTDIYVICLTRKQTGSGQYTSHLAEFYWYCDGRNKIIVDSDGYYNPLQEARVLIYRLPPPP